MEFKKEIIKSVFEVYKVSDKKWDDVEYHPMSQIKDEEIEYIEQCKKGEEDFWSVYIHLCEGGLECIADVETEEQAKEFAKFIKTITKNYNGTK